MFVTNIKYNGAIAAPDDELDSQKGHAHVSF
jgi:hypothetical protein